MELSGSISFPGNWSKVHAVQWKKKFFLLWCTLEKYCWPIVSTSEKSHLGTDNKGTRLQKQELKEECICLFHLEEILPILEELTLIKAQRNTSAKHAAIPIWSGQLNPPASHTQCWNLERKGVAMALGKQRSVSVYLFSEINDNFSFWKMGRDGQTVFTSPTFSGDGKRNPIRAYCCSC